MGAARRQRLDRPAASWQVARCALGCVGASTEGATTGISDAPLGSMADLATIKARSHRLLTSIDLVPAAARPHVNLPLACIGLTRRLQLTRVCAARQSTAEVAKRLDVECAFPASSPAPCSLRLAAGTGRY